jgi:hypothetical protein
MTRMVHVVFLLSILVMSTSLPAADNAAPGVADPDPALPTEFAFVLNNGYGENDRFSGNPAVFENLLVNMKKAGFNTIYCVYRDWRVPLCRKHGVKMMVDVLAWKEDSKTDIRRNAEQRARVKEICEKSRGDDAIWGYNIWNERLPWFGNPDGKSIDDYIRMLKEWDPTHPVWMGTYRVIYADAPKSRPGVHAYYDYAWQRGFLWHFADLNWYLGHARSQKGVIGQWELGSDYNRNSYKLNTSIPFGLKVMIWFIGGPFDDAGNIDPKHRFYHLVKIGQEMQPLYKELGKFGMPEAVYSTPTTKTEDDKPKETNVPWGLKAFPDGHWMQVTGGEVLCGFFRYAGGGDAIYVANHNAFAEQQAAIALAGDAVKKATLEIFDREAGEWKPLEKRDGAYAFPIRAAGGELLRIQGRVP